MIQNSSSIRKLTTSRRRTGVADSFPASNSCVPSRRDRPCRPKRGTCGRNLSFVVRTAQQNNLNRWYDPKVGRWISEDPIGFAAGDSNLYRYVGNSPTNATDPNGLQSVAQIDPTYVQQRQSLVNIYKQYAALYKKDPVKYQWAGLATHAGAQVVTQILDRLQDEKLRFLDVAVQSRMYLDKHGMCLNVAERRQMALRAAAVYGEMQKIVTQMAFRIFNDIGKQFQAYDQGGLGGIQQLIDNDQLDQGALQAWQLIDGGKVTEGTALLTQREQVQVLNPGYGQINKLAPFSLIGRLMSSEAESGLPGCKTFREVFDKGLFSDTNPNADENLRWLYISRHVLTTWGNMSQQQQMATVDNALNLLNSPGVTTVPRP